MMKKIVAVSAVVASTTTASMAPAEQIGENSSAHQLAQCSHYAMMTMILDESNTLYDEYADMFFAAYEEGVLFTDEEDAYYKRTGRALMAERKSPDFDLEGFVGRTILSAEKCTAYLRQHIVLRRMASQ
jgi:hypothetical protein